MTLTERAALLTEAARLIDEFASYSDAMCKIGRGFSYSGPLGHDPRDMAEALRRLNVNDLRDQLKAQQQISYYLGAVRA